MQSFLFQKMPFNTKLLVPVALGFSLVSVSAFVVYYVFKKDEDEDKPIRSAKVNVIEVQVPKSIVAALIGKLCFTISYVMITDIIFFFHISLFIF